MAAGCCGRAIAPRPGRSEWQLRPCVNQVSRALLLQVHWWRLDGTFEFFQVLSGLTHGPPALISICDPPGSNLRGKKMRREKFNSPRIRMCTLLRDTSVAASGFPIASSGRRSARVVSGQRRKRDSNKKRNDLGGPLHLCLPLLWDLGRSRRCTTRLHAASRSPSVGQLSHSVFTHSLV